ncbi:MAG: hypothetical protein RSE41_07475, partial [Clostridia bacterium]
MYRKYRKYLIYFTCILFVIGAYIGFKYGAKDTKVYIEENKVETIDPVEVLAKENPDIEVTYITYYTKCKHEVIEKNTEFGSNIEDLILKNKEYTVKDRTATTLTLIKNIDTNCSNHFKLTLTDGNVVIYNVISDTVCTLYKNTLISENRIRDELKEELRNGVIVNSTEELYT